MQRYPKLSHILPYLREPSNGRSVEEVLESLQDEANGFPERLREFASVRYYLRDLLFEATSKWLDQTNGVTNYAPLIGEILRLNKGSDPICLVTFNYDLLLDRALLSFDYHPQAPHDQFKAHPVLKLFRPHGSVDWARFVYIHPDTGLQPQHLIEEADTIHSQMNSSQSPALQRPTTSLEEELSSRALPYHSKTRPRTLSSVRVAT